MRFLPFSPDRLRCSDFGTAASFIAFLLAAMGTSPIAEACEMNVGCGQNGDTCYATVVNGSGGGVYTSAGIALGPGGNCDSPLPASCSFKVYKSGPTFEPFVTKLMGGTALCSQGHTGGAQNSCQGFSDTFGASVSPHNVAQCNSNEEKNESTGKKTGDPNNTGPCSAKANPSTPFINVPTPGADLLDQVILGPQPLTDSDGNPVVNLATGRIWYKVRDIHVQVPGPRLDFIRTYYNHGGVPTSGPVDTAPLGTNWSHNYQTALDDSEWNSGAGVVRVNETDGSTSVYAAEDNTNPSNRLIRVDSYLTSTFRLDGSLWVREFSDGASQEFEVSTGRLLKSTNRAGQDQVLVYAPSGNLDRVRDEISGRELVFSYDDVTAPTRITKVATSPTEFASVTFDYVTNGSAVELVEAINPIRTEEYEYIVEDPFGVDDVRTAYLEFIRYCEAPSTGCIQVSGMSYLNGRLESITRGDGGLFLYDYSTPNQTTVTNVQFNESTTYTFDPDSTWPLFESYGGGGCASCSSGGTTDYEWDIRLRSPTAITNAEGTTTRLKYNADGLIEEMIEAEGTALERSTVTEYVPGSTLVDRILSPSVAGSPQPVETDFQYNDTAHPNLVTDIFIRGYTDTDGDGFINAGSRVSEHTQILYTTSGQIDEILGPQAGRRTKYIYFANGDLQEIRRYVTSAEYLAVAFDNYTETGIAQLIIDQANVPITRVVDAGNRISSRSLTVGGESRDLHVAFNVFSQPDLITLPKDNTFTFVSDEKGRIRYEQNDEGDQLETIWDEMDRRDRQVWTQGGELHREIDFQYDSPAPGDLSDDSRLVRRQIEIGLDTFSGSVVQAVTAFAYDELGRPTAAQSGPTSISHSYDEFGRLKTNSKGGAVNTYGYDSQDNRLTWEDPDGRIISYRYDDWGRVIWQNLPDSGSEIFVYEAGGYLKEWRDSRGIVKTYSYDLIGRVLDVTFSGSDESNYTQIYDVSVGSGAPIPGSFQAGRIAQITDSSGTKVFSYNEAGEITHIAETLGSAGWFVTEYGYDRNGNLTSIVYPSGREQVVVYDLADRPMSSTFDGQPIIDHIEYSPVGLPVRYEYSNGIDTDITRGLYAMPTRVHSERPGLAPVMSQDYFLQGNGHIGSTNNLLSPNEILYQYNAQDRLNSVDYNVGVSADIAFSYDLSGNRQSKTVGTNVDQYVYDSGTNRLDVTGSLSFAYNSAGDIASVVGLGPVGPNNFVESKQFHYNASGHLKSSERQGVGSAYLYDFINRRWRKSLQKNITGEYSVARIFVYDLSGEIIAELGRNGAPIAEYVYVGGERVTKYGLDPTGDEDADGLSNFYEEKFNLQPFIASDATQDPDGDQLTNAEEATYSTDPFQADTDHDGYTDLEEVTSGTDPLDAGSTPAGSAPETFFEDNDCDGVFEPADSDRPIGVLVQAAPFQTTGCVVALSVVLFTTDEIDIDADGGIRLAGSMTATDTAGTGITLTTDGELDLTGATLTSASSITLNGSSEDAFLTGATLVADENVTVSSQGLVSGVGTSVTATVSATGSISVTTLGLVYFPDASLTAATDITLTSQNSNASVSGATLTGNLAISASTGSGTIDYRDATISDISPSFTGIEITNGSIPSAQFPIFDPALHLSTGANPKQVTSGDFNNDGWPDLAVAVTGNYLDNGSDRGGISVMLGNGDGTLSPFAYYEDTGDGPLAIATEDLDGDGNFDLVATRAGDILQSTPGNDHGGVVVYQGDGTGHFQKRQSFPSGKAPGAIALADFTGDGTLDLAVAYSGIVRLYDRVHGFKFGNAVIQNSVEIFEGTGAATFNLNSQIYDQIASSPWDIDAGDFNGDGAVDLAVACQGDEFNGGTDPGGVGILLNTNGSSSDWFNPPTMLTTGVEKAESVQVIQLDSVAGTGIDLVVGRTDTYVVPLVGDGLGGFVVGTADELAVSPQPNAMDIGDMDEDQLDDVMVIGSITGKFTTVLSAGDGTFAGSLLHNTGQYPRSIAVVDIDQDTHLDVAVVDDALDVVNIYYGLGDGDFDQVEEIVSEFAPTSVVATSFNNDSDPDIATLNAGSQEIRVFLGDGAGGFSNMPPVAGGTSPASLNGLDLNGDTAGDLIWLDIGTGMKVARGFNTGTFEAPNTVATPGITPFLLKAGDFTLGDNVTDVALVGVLGNGNYGLGLMQGAGDGLLYVNPVTVDFGTSTDPPTAVTYGDWSGDGRVDYLVAFESGVIHGVIGVGTNQLSFVGSVNIAAGSFPRDLALLDVEMDGDLDIVSVNSGVEWVSGQLTIDDPNGYVSFFENQGGGVFASDSPISVGTQPYSIQVADYNNDTYPDVSITRLESDINSVTPGGVEVLISDGVGGFVGPDLTALSFYPFAHATADLDGDGKIDAVVADAIENNLFVLLNEVQLAGAFELQFRTLAKKLNSWKDGLAKSGEAVLRALGDGMVSTAHAQVPPPGTNYNLYWYHYDATRAPRVMTEDSGMVVWQAQYTPFGKIVISVELAVNPFRFPGQYFDIESGLYYNWHRYYDPNLGRYLTVDPLADIPGMESYAYAVGNPLIFVDPYGLSAWATVGSIAKCFIYGVGAGGVGAVTMTVAAGAVTMAAGPFAGTTFIVLTTIYGAAITFGDLGIDIQARNWGGVAFNVGTIVGGVGVGVAGRAATALMISGKPGTPWRGIKADKAQNMRRDYVHEDGTPGKLSEAWEGGPNQASGAASAGISGAGVGSTQNVICGIPGC